MPFQRRKEWGPSEPTDEECVQNCLRNAAKCAEAALAAKRIYDSAMPGTLEVSTALHDVNRYRGEEKHWNMVARWHLKRVEEAKLARVVNAGDSGDDTSAYGELGGGVPR